MVHLKERMRRFVRYAGVSILATVLAQIGLFIAFGAWGWPVAPAVIFSLAVSVGPAYVLSRRYVWADTARPRVAVGEATGFVLIALIGSVTTLVVVWLAVRIAGTFTWDHVTLSFVASSASMVSTGVVWVARYAALNRFLFARPASETGTEQLVPASSAGSASAVVTATGGPAYD
jgi:putative flippase GtrA